MYINTFLKLLGGKLYASVSFNSLHIPSDRWDMEINEKLYIHQEINGQVEMTWQILKNIAHSIMVHVRVSDEYIIFHLMYMTDNILPVLPIKSC